MYDLMITIHDDAGNVCEGMLCKFDEHPPIDMIMGILDGVHLNSKFAAVVCSVTDPQGDVILVVERVYDGTETQRWQ